MFAVDPGKRKQSLRNLPPKTAVVGAAGMLTQKRELQWQNDSDKTITASTRRRIANGRRFP